MRVASINVNFRKCYNRNVIVCNLHNNLLDYNLTIMSVE